MRRRFIRWRAQGEGPTGWTLADPWLIIVRRPGGSATIATETDARGRVDSLRDHEPDPFSALPADVEAFILALRDLLISVSPDDASLSESQSRYLREAAARQVRFAHARLERDRQAALEILGRLFSLGAVPRPDGRYKGEIIAVSTGLLSDPFFEWLTRLYLPWLGKTFDAANGRGDNIFLDNAWSKATSHLGWPAYRRASDEPPGTVRVFPFRTYAGPAIDEPDVTVLKIDYSDAPNPLPVRRVVDEIVELPGGYILGKAHMRGLCEFRRVAFFSLTKPD